MSDIPSLSAATAIVVGPAVNSALNAIGTGLKNFSNITAKRLFDETKVALRLGFQDYLQINFSKCSTFKSILTPNLPLNVIHNYVNVNVSIERLEISDIMFIEKFKTPGLYILTGLAGSGKSMMLKYMTIKLFEGASGTVPLFIELRNFNSISSSTLLTFIRNQCSSSSNAVSEDQFKIALGYGVFSFILDGFDELQHEIREKAQKEISEIRKNFPKVSILVSSRPDDRFKNWSASSVYSVVPLTKDQVIKLVNSFQYDNDIKKRFVNEVKTRLFKSHESFLVYPLLATIMLLTFESVAQIPEKLHLFYSQAFDTLFEKHDAGKDQYRRKKYSGLTKDDFQKCFSVFCALSYAKEKFSFSEEELINFAENSINYFEIDRSPQLNPKNLIADLRESVCMIQPDGLLYAFVHRSFQEYFVAYFLTQVHSSKLNGFIQLFKGRFTDSALPMAFDMARDAMEIEWVLPQTKKFYSKFRSMKSLERNFNELITAKTTVNLINWGKTILVGSSHREIDFAEFHLLARLYPTELWELRGGIFYKEVDAVEFQSLIQKNILPVHKNYSNWQKILKFDSTNSNKDLTIKLDENDKWIFPIIKIGMDATKVQSTLKKIEVDVGNRQRRRREISAAFG